MQTAEALSGWRVKTGRDLGKGKEQARAENRKGEDRMRKEEEKRSCEDDDSDSKRAVVGKLH